MEIRANKCLKQDKHYVRYVFRYREAFCAARTLKKKDYPFLREKVRTAKEHNFLHGVFPLNDLKIGWPLDTIGRVLAK